jgi:hypothetical protein
MKLKKDSFYKLSYYFIWTMYVLLFYRNFFELTFLPDLNRKEVFIPLLTTLLIFLFFKKQIFSLNILIFQYLFLIALQLFIVYKININDVSIFLQAPDTETYFNLYSFFFGCDENSLYACKESYTINHRLPTLPIIIGFLDFFININYVPSVFSFLVSLLWLFLPLVIFKTNKIYKTSIALSLIPLFPLITAYGYLLLTDAIFSILFWFWYFKFLKSSNPNKYKSIYFVFLCIAISFLRPEGLIFLAIAMILHVNGKNIKIYFLTLLGILILLNIWNGNSELEKAESKIYIVNVVPKTLQVEEKISFSEARKISSQLFEERNYDFTTILFENYPVSLKQILSSQAYWLNRNTSFSWIKQYENLPNTFIYFHYLLFKPLFIIGWISLLLSKDREDFKIGIIILIWISFVALAGPVDIPRFNLFINLPLIYGLTKLFVLLQERIKN